MPQLPKNQNSQYRPMMKNSSPEFATNSQPMGSPMAQGRLFGNSSGRSVPMGRSPQEIAEMYRRHRASMFGGQ